MPGKAKKGKPGSTVGGSTDTASLLSLPAPVLTHIAESCWRSYSGGVAAIHGHPLLGVSQACRDAVLHATKTIRLVPDFRQAGPSAAQKSAAARLLHRACCEAAPGLKVVLDTDFFPADMLSVLLQPGLRNGGWTKVHSLKVSASGHDDPVPRIPVAFPCLRELSIATSSLSDGALFHALARQPSCMLNWLEIYDCDIRTKAVRRAAQSLARFPHLRALTVAGLGVPVRIAAELTGLTSLTIKHNTDVEAAFRVAGQNTGLVELEFSELDYPVPASHLINLLTNCTSLTKLDISSGEVDGQALDVLLTQCTSITDLTLGDTTLDSSRADRQCSWRRLSLQGPGAGILLQLAYLPLKSVQELQGVYDTRLDKPVRAWLDLPSPAAAVPAAQLPSLLHQAATNLATCPAWMHAAPSQLALRGAGHELAADEQVQLFQALAPLGAHVTTLVIMLRGELQLDAADVQALATSTAGSLTALSLYNCILPATFWKALAHHFPQLSSLGLCRGVLADATDIGAYLSVQSCSSPQATSMCLTVNKEVLDEKSLEWLEEHLSVWRLQNITLQLE